MHSKTMNLKNTKNFFFFNLFKVKYHVLTILIFSFISTIFITVKPALLAIIVNKTLNYFGNNFSNNNSNTESLEGKNFFDLNSIENTLGKFFEKSNTENIINFFIILIILLIITSLLGSIFKYISNYYNSLARAKVTANVRATLSTKLISYGLSFFNNSKSGDLISRVMNDSLAYAQGVVSISHRMFESILLIIIYSIYLISTNFYLTLWILLILFLHYVITLLFKKPIKKFEKKIYDTSSKLSVNLQETFANIRLIKIFGADIFESKKLTTKIKQSSKALHKSQSISYIEPEGRIFLNNLAEALLIFVSIIFLIKGLISIQGFILYLYVARLIMFPVTDLSTQIVWIQRIKASFENIEKLLTIKNRDNLGTKKITSFKKNIKISNLNFGYNDNIILKDIDLSINKNDRIAIIGRSGVGKSTFSDLLLNMYALNSGVIQMDGYDINEYIDSNYKKLFGVVTQESFLFNDTIENNIKFGRDLTIDNIIDSAKISNCHDFISAFPEKYQTIIGDRGIKLSGGQKQRIAIARAIASMPDIIIFDEATSSLDTKSEKEVQDAINNLSNNHTIVIIAHRLSTIKNCNRIFIIEDNKIKEIGDYNYLLNHSEIFKKLFINESNI